jgi:O-glycosyl hydrolase
VGSLCLKKETRGVHRPCTNFLRYFYNQHFLDQNVIKITIDPSQTYQTILGFGGAFTEATGFNIKTLQNKTTQDYLVKSYYGDEGTLAKQSNLLKFRNWL